MPHVRYVGSGYSGHWEVDAKQYTYSSKTWKNVNIGLI